MPGDIRRFGKIVVAEVARPADRVGDVVARRMDEEGRKEQSVSRLDRDRNKVRVLGAVDVPVPLVGLRFVQPFLVAARYDSQSTSCSSMSTSGIQTTMELSDPCMLRQS